MDFHEAIQVVQAVVSVERRRLLSTQHYPVRLIKVRSLEYMGT